MPSINTNVSALRAQDALVKNSRSMDSAMQSLSTGKRINSAKDDAAGLGLVENMTAQVRGLNQAVRNLNDGTNMLQTADGALVETSNMLQRMRELAIQSSNATYSSTQRAYLQTEFTALSTQIGRVATETKWNDKQLLVTAAQSFVFQAGQASGQTISVTINAMTATGLAIATAGGAAATIGTATGASAAIDTLDNAIDLVNAQRASLGATMNQMTYGVDNLTNVSTNIAASRSNVQDTDYAQASTNLSKSQIVQQAATAMLAQANQQPQSVLALLK